MPTAKTDSVAAQILIVEDESSIREMLRVALEREGHIVHTAGSVPAARALLAEQRPDLALLDWMLPGTSGLQFLKELRSTERHAALPVIMLTARTGEREISAGLDAGADDYVSKPFSPRELCSRVRALLRRSRDFDADEGIQVGPLHLDLMAHQLTVDGAAITIGHTEFKLLHFLMKRPERVYSRAQLLEHVWGPDTYIEERTVDVHILRLRKTLRPHGAGDLIETVRGAGYKLTASATTRSADDESDPSGSATAAERPSDDVSDD